MISRVSDAPAPESKTRNVLRRRALQVEKLEAELAHKVRELADTLLRAWGAEEKLADLTAARDAFRASNALLAARVTELEAELVERQAPGEGS